MNRSAKQYMQEKSQRLEENFVKYADLRTVLDVDMETDREGFYVIPNIGNGVIGRFHALRDMENKTPNIIVRETVYNKLCDADRTLKRKAGYENCQIVVTYGYRSPEIQEKLYNITLAKKKNNTHHYPKAN